MLFDSSLRKELSRSFGATLAIVLTTVLTMALIRTLGEAAGGNVAPQDVALMLGYATVGYLPTILSLSVFVAIVSTLTRMFRDSEMAIWFSSGVSLFRFLPPVLRMTAPVVLTIALLSLVIWPWSNRQINDLRDRHQQRSDLSRVAPGQFQTSADGRRIFFIDRNSPDALLSRNIFIVDRALGRESITTAQSGRIDYSPQGVRYLVLQNGTRSDHTEATGAKSVAHFDEYRIKIGETTIAKLIDRSPKSTDTLDLLSGSEHRLDMEAEMSWRISLVLGSVNLALLGMALPAGNPRRNSSAALMLALLAFVVYLNLVNLLQAWTAAGRVSLIGGLIGLHGGSMLGIFALLWWRDRGVAAPSLWPHRTKAAS
ncbi:LPS export ABC transporter permease LptF [Leptothrix ochracea]|uniref:LPS export ABC transporter permease LptF n=1 Tax=Leptothrix ochracea TaxID=735331 RepID=UPI0034E1C9C2